jgi:hypothetical protein
MWVSNFEISLWALFLKQFNTFSFLFTIHPTAIVLPCIHRFQRNLKVSHLYKLITSLNAVPLNLNDSRFEGIAFSVFYVGEAWDLDSRERTKR